MKTYGLTGGIGMGKSAAAQRLRSRGVPVVDTDDLARGIVELGMPALDEIRRSFGTVVIAPDGGLRREELARIVFNDESSRKKLESILHPRIREGWQSQIHDWKNDGKAAAVVVIPLLFETKAETEFDVVICAACSAGTQSERLKARGWSSEEISRRNAAQLSVQAKMDRSHHVLWTEGSLDSLRAQLDRIFFPPA